MSSTIGPRVDIIRERKGLTHQALADLLGVDRSTVTKWASGASGPRDLEAVAKVLGVSVADIFGAKAPKSRKRAA